MKRCSVATEIVDIEYLNELSRIEARAKIARRCGRFVFVIVCGPVTGIFHSFVEVKRLGAELKGRVYRKFSSSQEAYNWYDASLRLPNLGPRAMEIHMSSRCYDVTRENDTYAAVAIYFGANDKRNICLQAKICSSDELHKHLFDFILPLIPNNRPIRIISDSKKYVYGINYGLWEWPRHILSKGSEKESAINSFIKKRGIEMCWRDVNNIARDMVIGCCIMQEENKIQSFDQKHLLEQRIAWILCAKRMGIHHDIRRKITKMIYYPISSSIVF